MEDLGQSLLAAFAFVCAAAMTAVTALILNEFPQRERGRRGLIAIFAIGVVATIASTAWNIAVIQRFF